MARFDSTDRLDAGLRFDETPPPVLPIKPKPRKLMSLFNLSLQTKTVPQKLDMGSAHITAMTGNADYPAATRVPADAQVAAAQAALDTANQDADAAEIVWKQKNATRNDAEDAWDTVITARANNCESVTPGDAAKLTGSGLPMRGAPAPSGPLGAPQNLRATMGDMSGEVDTMWDRLKGSSSNVIQCREQGTGSWNQAGFSQQSKFTVVGLISGKFYEFRVHGIGKDGAGPWSDLALCMAA